MLQAHKQRIDKSPEANMDLIKNRLLAEENMDEHDTLKQKRGTLI